MWADMETVTVAVMGTGMVMVERELDTGSGTDMVMSAGTWTGMVPGQTGASWGTGGGTGLRVVAK